jgi:hypothetical protein
MGRKSRLKKERKEKGLGRELNRHPMRQEILSFFKKRRLEMNQSAGLLHVISLMASFFIFISIMKQPQLPVINPEENKADKDRLHKLGSALEHECYQLDIVVQEVMDELVLPMSKNEALMEPIIQRIHQMLDSLISSQEFRQGTEAQMDNSELWGDSLKHYGKQKEGYFQAVKKLFALVLAISRASVEEKLEAVDHENRLEKIRKTYGIEPDEFVKLRRRAQEFFRIAFAKHLSMVFQPVRDDVDSMFSSPTSTSLS